MWTRETTQTRQSAFPICAAEPARHNHPPARRPSGAQVDMSAAISNMWLSSLLGELSPTQKPEREKNVEVHNVTSFYTSGLEGMPRARWHSIG